MVQPLQTFTEKRSRGAKNQLWAYGYQEEYVWEVDPANDTVTRRYPTQLVNSSASLVTGNGLVWVLDPSGSVKVLTPEQGFDQTIQLHAGLTGMAVAGQWLWVTSSDGRLYKISLYTKDVRHVYQLHHQAVAVAAGYNRVWVSLGQ